MHDYYRVFESPGLAHCANGRGAYPAETFHALVEWVENGKAPDVLHGTSLPDEDGAVKKRILCPYPKRARYTGSGDPNTFSNWYCEKSPLLSQPGELDSFHVQQFWETS